MRVELTVTLKGQVTLRQAVLDHLGVKPGGRVDVEPLPDGRAELRPAGARPIWLACAAFFAGPARSRCPCRRCRTPSRRQADREDRGRYECPGSVPDRGRCRPSPPKRRAIEEADAVFISTVVLCEVVRVLKRAYRYKAREIADTLRSLIESRTVETNRAAAGGFGCSKPAETSPTG